MVKKKETVWAIRKDKLYFINSWSSDRVQSGLSWPKFLLMEHLKLLLSELWQWHEHSFMASCMLESESEYFIDLRGEVEVEVENIL